MQILKFWWDCFKIGWSIGGAFVSAVKLITFLVSAILALRKRTQGRKDWEDFVLKASFKIFIFLVIVTTLFVAPYLKFSSADNARIIAEANGPRLDGFIDQEIVGEGGQSNSLVILQVSVNNAGNRPSVADHYRLSITLTNHTTLEGELVDIPDEYTTITWKSNSPLALTLKRSELISEKTSKAIAPGEGPRGWIAYNFHHLLHNEYSPMSHTMVLSFLDVGGNKIFVTNGMWKGKPITKLEFFDKPRAFPGSDNLMSRPVSEFIVTNTSALPPELPQDCTNVVLFFGSQSMSISKTMAEISREGTQFNIADLPDFLLTDLDKLPNYSPRRRTMWYKMASMRQDFGGTQVTMPIMPHVVSNRLFVEFAVPYLNEMRRLIMSDDFDDSLSKIPHTWDRNYATNCFAYEIVNEYTNPVFQVFYTAANEVHVNGLFIVDTNKILETFGTPPLLQTMASYKIINMTNMQEVTNVFEMLGTNTVGDLITNTLYDLKFPGQKAMFKYPSNRHPGEFAN